MNLAIINIVKKLMVFDRKNILSIGLVQIFPQYELQGLGFTNLIPEIGQKLIYFRF